MRAAFRRPSEVGQGPGAVKASELVTAVFVDGVSPSAAARKVHVLLLARAAGDAWQDRWHSITKADLGLGHQSRSRLHATMDELLRTLLRIRVASDIEGEPDDILTGAVVSEYRIAIKDGPQARLQWRFSSAMREVMRRSEHYADLRLEITAALESRYSVTLYEMGSKYAGLKYEGARIWRGTPTQLREQLGVPETYRDWSDVARRCLRPAVAEVNQIAPFLVSVEEIKQGRAVREVAIQFTPKQLDGVVAAEKELTASKVGRRARRDGAVETATPIDADAVQETNEAARKANEQAARFASLGIE